MRMGVCRCVGDQATHRHRNHYVILNDNPAAAVVRRGSERAVGPASTAGPPPESLLLVDGLYNASLNH